MKLHTKVTNLTHDEIVTIFADNYGSHWATFAYDMNDYYGTPLEDDDDCLEDKLAKILLGGGRIYINDHYAEDGVEVYGSLPHAYDEEEEYMQYSLRLEDIEAGLAKALDDMGCGITAIYNFLHDDRINFDINDADTLLQHITFGEVIYG